MKLTRMPRSATGACPPSTSGRSGARRHAGRGGHHVHALGAVLSRRHTRQSCELRRQRHAPCQQLPVWDESLRRVQHGGERGRVDDERQLRRLPCHGRGVGRTDLYVREVRGPTRILQLGQTGLPTGATCPRDGNDQGGLRIEKQQEIPVYSPLPASAFSARLAKDRYQKTPLDARIEETRQTPEWTREKISFNGADGERALAYLYRPHHVATPMQVLHYVPGGDVDSGHRALPESMDDRMGMFVKAGRAAFGVVLKGYIERLSPAWSVAPDPGTVEYLERIVNRVTDVRRGLDYLETCPDVDMTRLGFVGPSSGARIGMVLAAVEPRYTAVVMIGAGLPASYQRYVPDANPIDFVSHIRGPKRSLRADTTRTLR